MKKYPYIGICGSIGSGKSTLTPKLVSALNSLGHPFVGLLENTKDNDYFQDFYSAISEYYHIQGSDQRNNYELIRYINERAEHMALAIQFAFLNNRRADHYEIQFSRRHAGFIQDRTIFEDGLFVELLYKEGILSKRSKQTYQDCYDIERLFFQKPDLFIYLEVTPEKCLQRIQKRERKEEVGISLDYLAKLEGEYKQFLEIWKKRTEVLIVPWEEDNLPIDPILSPCLELLDKGNLDKGKIKE